MKILIVFFLQSEPAVIDAVTSHFSEGLTTIQVVIISFITYVIGVFVQYGVSWLLRRTDVKNDRKMKIAEISIAKEISIFKSLVELRGFQKNESAELLDSIQTLQIQLNNDRILFSTHFYKAAQEIVEYFSIVAGDYTRKDVKKESSLFDSLYDSFHNK